MPRSFVIAANPDPDSKLPYLLRIPVGANDLILKARDTWPRTSAVYCHRADGWPEDAVIVDTLDVRECARRGKAIDLVLARKSENRSQFVLTQARGREMILWQSPRTTAKARPGVRVPTRRASGISKLEIVVDTRERYAWKFTHQQATTVNRGLRVGDYATFLDDELVGVVERKSLADLVGCLVDGSLTYTVAELATHRRAALVVEDRYSAVFKLDRVQPAWVAELLASVQVRYPGVPIVFCENRALAQEWTYRWLAAALTYAQADSDTEDFQPNDTP